VPHECLLDANDPATTEATGDFANAVPPQSAGAVPESPGRNTSLQATSYGMARPSVKQNYEKRRFAAARHGSACDFAAADLSVPPMGGLFLNVLHF
jgi:hypothetical protein